MIDYGLLMIMIIAFGLPTVVACGWPLTSSGEPVDYVDVAVGPAVATSVFGRLVILLLDDSNSMGSISDMVIVRSGVEFWPGVAAAIAALAWSSRRAESSLLAKVAAGPARHARPRRVRGRTCVSRLLFRAESDIGLRPPGLSPTMVPVGWFIAGTVATGAVGVRGLAARGASQGVIVSAAALGVATVRAVGSIWLPHVGGGLTGQHLTSIAVAVGAGVALLIALVVPSGRRADEAPGRV